MNAARIATLIVFALLAGCGGGEQSPPQRGVSVYKHAGSVQCEGGGTPLPAMRRQLTDAGISVLGAACGLDGMGYPTVCGAPDGVIHVFEVPGEQTGAAQAIGFAPLGNLPNASVFACP